MTIDNMEDVIDSREVIERYEELQEMAPNYTSDEAAELKTLSTLCAEGEDCSEDWQYGATLIRDSYFEEYAQELADDCGMIPDNLTWPMTCIDWAQAARELRMDYTSIEFDGVTYWVR